MDCRLFLQEKDDFCRLIYGLRLGEIVVLQAVMEKSIEKNGLSLPFLIVPRGFTHALIQKVFREKLGIDYSFSPELDILGKAKHDRWPDQSYIIRHGGHREANKGDAELKLLSAEKIWERGIETMTSLEVSQFSLENFLTCGAPIDVNSISLCPGSRYSDGRVPHVFFGIDEVEVYRHDPSFSHDTLRSRSVTV
ncbi:MAG: hypothetical protein PHE24_00245 [Patescibacteria group bacterium]|nr:hypothetical protein [Patescibacteria group bacterium]